MSELEQDYDKLAEEINAKVKEAAEKIRELNELRAKAKLPTLINGQYLYDAVKWENRDLERDELLDLVEGYREKLEKIDLSPLEEEINDAGWSTSSAYC